MGLLFLWFSQTLTYLGYDLLFVLPTDAPRDAVIIYMDYDSAVRLGQTNTYDWNRSSHVQLLDKLTLDHPRVVVFDVIFDTSNSPAIDANFARAIRNNGRVVLAAAQMTKTRRQLNEQSVVRSIDVLFDAAAAWGVAGVLRPIHSESQPTVIELIARQYFRGDDRAPSLPWAAAKLAGAPITKRPNAQEPELFLRFYGPALWLPKLSFADALDKERGFFRDKCVFIGVLPQNLRAYDQADVFPTPHTRFGRDHFAGVEIGATAFLNLLREDGLIQISPFTQVTVVLIAGLGFGGLLALMRPWAAFGFAIGGTVLLAMIVVEVANHHFWFSWPVIAFVQIPLALAWSLASLYVRLKFDRDLARRTLAETTRLFEATKLTAQKAQHQLVPDHDLVRLVGKGAYGEVWLARNAVGVYHAVKIVRRAAFPSDIPYEREFRGIQKFMPVSRSHPGFVHILHVGRNDAERCFYCIMEAGDDQTVGQKIDPETYTPKSLASELKWRGRLGAEETLRLGLALTLALEHLHQNKLIHRDIKPGNIIFVNGQPKFADIGLVTDIAGEGKDVSFLGTQGYIPPEGPGSAGADVYALGKVLYETAMGRDREFFPEVPTAVYEEPEDSLLRRLQTLIFKACEASAEDRYRTAAQMHADLLDLEKRQSQRATRTE